MSQNTDQILPLHQSAYLQAGRPRTQETFQFFGNIPCESAHKDERFNLARQCLLRWMQKRVPSVLPEAANSGDSFQIITIITRNSISCQRVDNPCRQIQFPNSIVALISDV